jgi:hypothetical protein
MPQMTLCEPEGPRFLAARQKHVCMVRAFIVR